MNGNARRLAFALLIALSAAFSASPAPAAETVVECEDFEVHDWHDIGGLPIAALFCAGASGYRAVNGLDVPGEWISLRVEIVSPGCYDSRVAYQTEYDDDVNLSVRMADAPLPDDEILVDYWLTNGLGFG